MFLPTWLSFVRAFARRAFVAALVLSQLLTPAGTAMASDSPSEALADSSAPLVDTRPQASSVEGKTPSLANTLDAPETVGPIAPSQDSSTDIPDIIYDQPTQPVTSIVPIPDIPNLSPDAAIVVHTTGTVASGSMLEIAVLTEPVPGAERTGLSLSIALPAELVLLSGSPTVALPSLSEGDKSITTWQVGVAPEVVGSAAVEVEVGLHQMGAYSEFVKTWIAIEDTQKERALARSSAWTESSETQDVNGSVLANPTGRVRVVVPAESLPEGSSLNVQLLFDGTWEEAQSTSPTVALPATTADAIVAASPSSATSAAAPPPPPPGGTIPSLPTPVDAIPDVQPDEPVDQTPPDQSPVDEPPLVEEVPVSADVLDADSTGVLNFEDKGMPSVEIMGVNLFALWEISAQTPAAMARGEESDVHDLASGVLLRVDVAPWVEAGVNPASLRVWTREEDGDNWEALQNEEYDPSTQTISVWTSHFSQFGLGQGLDTSGDLLPSTNMFTVDEFSGASQTSVPIDAPTGLGGMSANMGFAYNSTTMDDWVRKDELFYADTQASSVGAGWNLTGVSYIARSDNKQDPTLDPRVKEFALVLEGQSVTILYTDGKWRTNPEIFAEVEWLHPSGTTGLLATDRKNGDAYDWNGWRITTTVGTVYEFGDRNNFTNTQLDYGYNVTMMGRYQNAPTHRITRRWYLWKATDTLGNYKEYVYRLEHALETNGIDTGWITAGKHWYVSSVDPEWVKWSAHDEAGTTYDSAAAMQLVFNYSTAARVDQPNAGPLTGDGIQTMFGASNKLDSVDVQVYANSGWQILKRYQLTQQPLTFSQSGNTQKRSTLTNIRILGEGAITPFQYFTYTYATKPSETNRIWLKDAKNSWGGSVTYLMGPKVVNCPADVCDENDNFMTRHVVTMTVANDGLGLPNNYSTVNTTYFYSSTSGTGYPGAVGEDGGFLGYEVVAIHHYDRGSTTVVLRTDKLKGFPLTHPDNPDPRRGKILRSEVLNGATLLSSVDYNWQSTWFSATTHGWETTSRSLAWPPGNTEHKTPPTWTRLMGKVEKTYISGATPEVKETQFSYSTATAYDEQFGNVVEVRDYVGGSLIRKTQTEYAAVNKNKWIAGLPKRVLVLNGSGVCVSETRNIYSAVNIEGNYGSTPVDSLLVKTEKLLSATDACPISTAQIGKYDAKWAITRYAYDRWGNQTANNRLGSGLVYGSPNITFTIDFDPNYHLFPIRQYYAATATYSETARYFGVNGDSMLGTNAAWGKMQEWCGVNSICTRQGYDQLGRKTHRWVNQLKNSTWPTSAAATTWAYYAPLAYSGQKSFMVREWSMPRCAGNLKRSHYNGFGELVAVQTSYQDWIDNTEGCGTTVAGREIHTYYKYDGLGRQVQVSIPVLLPRSDWLDTTQSTWPGGTTTVYNGLGQVTQTTAPNGTVHKVTRNSDADYQTNFVTVEGATDADDRMLSWKRIIDGGLQQILLTYNRSGSAWTSYAQLTQNYDVLGNLISIDHPNITLNTTFAYDKGGRKTGMTDDPDMGDWTYLYDRQGRLIAQRDAKGSVTCLYYDIVERISFKYIKTGALNTCAITAPPAMATDVMTFTYGASGPQRGQLTNVKRTGTAGEKPWSERSFIYNAAGLLQTETHYVQSATNVGQVVQDNLDYGYDAWFRPSTITYPDNEVVTTEYNGMGLPARLTSSTQGVIIDGDASSAIAQHGILASTVEYDVAGRLKRMRLNHTTDYWQNVAYDPFTQNNPDGGMLASIQVGTSADPDSILGLFYTWDHSGNVKTLNDDRAWPTMTYDHQNRLTNGFNTAYAYSTNGTFTSWQGLGVTTDSLHTHGIDFVDTDNRYDYDLNGNVVQRTVTGLTQALSWTRNNELASITLTNGGKQEYLYNADGIRVRQLLENSSGVLQWTNYEFFPQYERNIGSTTTNTKYYFFGDQRIAQKAGTATITYLHTDHLGSVLATTGVAGEKRYTAFGATRVTTTTVTTDYGYTGQHNDATGLLYYKARYYDPGTGQFMSPDTIVPDPDNIWDYNRYMYVRGNPLKSNDPTGHCENTPAAEDFECFYLAQLIYRQFGTSKEDWPLLAGSSMESLMDQYAQLTGQDASVSMEEALVDVMAQISGVSAEDMWEFVNSAKGKVQDNNPVVQILKGCASIMEGACGVSVGGSASYWIAGGRGGVSAYYDASGAGAAFIDVGGGFYPTPSGVAAKGMSVSVTVIPALDSLEKLSGNTFVLGFSGGLGGYVGFEYPIGFDSNGITYVGISGSVGLGGGVEGHAAYTYSHPMK